MDPRSLQTHFTLQTLLYAAALASGGGRSLLCSMGLREDQIDRFRTLNLEQAGLLSSFVHAKLIRLSFDPVAVDAALRTLERRQQECQLILALIKGGAPRPLMNQLFGMSVAEFSSLRKAHNLDDPGGRPRKPPESIQQDIWLAWQDNAHLPGAERYLAVHRATGTEIRVIVGQIREWSATHGRKPPPGHRLRPSMATDARR